MSTLLAYMHGDWFSFQGTENDGYKMVGNAVAPPMAEWIGEHVKMFFAN